ncbi:MAG: hypothetical protein AAFV07_01050 [Bacteroidota bacterium]
MHLYRIILFFPLLLGLACQNGPDPVKLLQDEVIAVHDEVMPQMGTMVKMKKALQARADGMIAQEADSTALTSIYEAIANLEQADREMMQWMRDFSPPSAEMEQEKALAYLRDEMTKITAVKEKSFAGLEQAKSILELNE